MLTEEVLNKAISLTEEKLKSVTEDKRANLAKNLESLSPSEIVAYQELKSIAQINGKISLGVAMWIYNLIGNWSRAKLSHKIVLTQLIGAMVTAKQ